ncbi:Serine/threonine-protein phosphatase 7 long form [Glycine soja]
MMVSEFFVASWILCNVMSLCGSLTQQSLYHCCLPFVYLEVAWCAVVPLICFQVIEWHQPDRQPIPESPSQPLNIHGITLKGKHDENWGQLFAPMIHQWNNRHAFRVDAYPRQEGLLSFNSDYMVWYRRKTKMFVDPQNANTATLSSVETQGIDRRREAVEAEEYSQQMAERGHEMYYTPQTFAQYPTQMYQYPFQGHHTDTSASQHSFGGVAETQAHFSWPTMTPSQQYQGPIPTPNALLGTQWNVQGPIPNMGDLLGRRLTKKKRGGIGAEEILIAKHEHRIDHVAHPHGITDTKMNDLHVSGLVSMPHQKEELPLHSQEATTVRSMLLRCAHSCKQHLYIGSSSCSRNHKLQ